MTLSEDQREKRAIEIVAFFTGLSEDEIDDVVMRARRKAKTKKLKNREDKLVEVLESHLDKLKLLGCPQTISEVFRGKKDKVISKMLEVWMKKYPDETLESLAARGIYLSIPVIRRSYMGIYALMPMVRYGDKIGYTYLNPNSLTDTLRVPDDPYYALDVEDGRAILGKPSIGAEGIINGQRRSCSIVDELIAIGMLTEVLSHHNMNAVGSRYESDNFPGLYLNNSGNGKPKLSYWSDLNCPDNRLGFPSCDSRI